MSFSRFGNSTASPDALFVQQAMYAIGPDPVRLELLGCPPLAQTHMDRSARAVSVRPRSGADENGSDPTADRSTMTPRKM